MISKKQASQLPHVKISLFFQIFRNYNVTEMKIKVAIKKAYLILVLS